MFTQIEHQFVQNFTNQFPCDARLQLFTQGKDPNKIYFPNKFNSNFNPLQQRKKFQEIKIDSVELDFPCLLLLPMLFSPFQLSPRYFPQPLHPSFHESWQTIQDHDRGSKESKKRCYHSRSLTGSQAKLLFPNPVLSYLAHIGKLSNDLFHFFPLAATKKKLCHFVPAARWQRTPPVAGGRKFSLILEVVLCLLFFSLGVNVWQFNKHLLSPEVILISTWRKFKSGW